MVTEVPEVRVYEHLRRPHTDDLPCDCVYVVNTRNIVLGS